MEWIKHSEYRANLDDYESWAASGECFVIKDDEEDIPRIAIMPFDVFQQFAREYAPKAINLLEMSHEDIGRIVDYEVPEDPREGEIEYDHFKGDPEYYLGIAYFEPLLITVERSRNWAVLPYEVLEKLHDGDRQALDELLKERPSVPSRRDYADQAALAILKGRIRNSGAFSGTEQRDEPMESEIDVDALRERLDHCLVRANAEPILVTMHGARQWALLPYELLEQVHRGERQVLDKLLKKRPRPLPPDRDYTDEETLAILEGRIPDPEAPEEPEPPEEPESDPAKRSD